MMASRSPGSIGSHIWHHLQPRQHRAIAWNVDLLCQCNLVGNLSSPGTGFAVGIVKGLALRFRQQGCPATTDREGVAIPPMVARNESS